MIRLEAARKGTRSAAGKGDKARLLLRASIELLPRAPAAARRSTPRIPSRAAYGTALGLWLIFFSLGIVSAVLLLAGALQAPAEPYTVAEALTSATEDVAGTATAIWLVVLLAYRYQLTRAQLGWRPDLPARRSFRHQGVLTAALYLTALTVALGLMGWLQQAGLGGHSYPDPPPAMAGVLPAVTGAVNAGIVEELVLVAALVTVLEHAHQPPWRIYTIGILVRWSFHIYYGNLGWGMLTTLPLLLWAAAAIGLFRWTRRITPLIGVHIGWDLKAGLVSQTGQILIVSAILLITLTALAAWTGYWARRDRRQARQRLDAAVPAAAAAAGVQTPRVSLSAAVGYPQLQQTWRSRPVLRYRPAAAIRHTDEQMSGLLAHELQHLAGHDPLPHTAAQRARDVLAAAATVVLVGCALIVLPPGLTEALAVDVPLTGIAWAVGAVTVLGLGAGMWLGRRHAIRTADQRHFRELRADRDAARVVGPVAVRAAIKTPGIYRERRNPRAEPFPPRGERLRALTPARDQGK